MIKANKLGRLTVTVTFKVLINLEYLGGEVSSVWDGRTGGGIGFAADNGEGSED